MIKGRASEDYLHTEVILSKVSEYEIFRYYCSNFKTLSEKFCSDLRKDSRPSVSIVEWKNGLLYKDFGHTEHTFNCFSYVMYKYNIDFISALKTISRDFGLGLDNSNSVRRAPKYEEYIPTPKKKAVIKIKSRSVNSLDVAYWSKYGVSTELIQKYNVIPIDYFWINDSRFRVKQLGYAYRFNSGYKIYQPFEEEDKWYSNVSSNVIQGYAQLPEKSEILFITSSLKDVLVINTLGYFAIAPQSEMVDLPEELVIELKERFPIIVVLYDNDFKSSDNPGQRSAQYLCGLHDFINFCIPSSYGSKDISDLVDNHGLDCAKEFIDNKLNMINHGFKDKRDSSEVCDAPF